MLSLAWSPFSFFRFFKLSPKSFKCYFSRVKMPCRDPELLNNLSLSISSKFSSAEIHWLPLTKIQSYDFCLDSGPFSLISTPFMTNNDKYKDLRSTEPESVLDEWIVLLFKSFEWRIKTAIGKVTSQPASHVRTQPIRPDLARGKVTLTKIIVWSSLIKASVTEVKRGPNTPRAYTKVWNWTNWRVIGNRPFLAVRKTLVYENGNSSTNALLCYKNTPNIDFRRIWSLLNHFFA